MSEHSESSFAYDVNLANQIEQFVYDEVFLGKNSNSSLVVQDDRVKLVKHSDDPDIQKLGCDILFTSPNGKNFFIDVKFASNYAGFENKPHLGTFALELSYVKDNNRVRGWLIDERKLTNVYAFGWINSIAKDGVHCSKSGYYCISDVLQITDCDIAFIERRKLLKAIREYLKLAGLPVGESDSSLMSYLRSLDGKAINHTIEPFKFGDDVLRDRPCLRLLRVHRTTYLAEAPVNLLFPRDILCSKDVAFHHLHCVKQSNGSWRISDLLR